MASCGDTRRFDRRKLWAKLGHPSRFDLLVARPYMSETTAFRRIRVARCSQSSVPWVAAVGGEQEAKYHVCGDYVACMHDGLRANPSLPRARGGLG